MVQGPSTNGSFSMAFAIFLQYETPKEIPFWVRAWNKNLTPKIEIFYRIFIQNKALIIDNLKKKGFIMPNRCCLSCDAKEDTNHLFLHCPFSQQVWSFFLQEWTLSYIFPCTIQDFCQQWIYPNSNERGKNMWMVAAPHISWRIQKE